MRIISWNVNGIRAVMKKDFIDSLGAMKPDILCLQETKAQDEQVREALSPIDGYHIFSNSAEKKGYSGTATLTKTEPVSVNLDIGIDEHDLEGRVIALEFDNFFLINVYTPNSGSELKRLEYRQRWDETFLAYLKNLEKKKPVIVCGDLNVAHKDIDLARPKADYNKSAGYMQEEIDGMDNLSAAGFVDTFRYINSDEVKYSWWSYRTGGRAKNVGWRIDYILASAAIAAGIKSADILNDISGSDHCPVMLEL
ncbi:MAG: exodeoxyribonuclease III [bacterium]|nr:exodeoxyribonuclease III [bacterium]